MKALKGTGQQKICQAFAGESQARNRYHYASVADKEGYKQIKNIFIEAADNERNMRRGFTNFFCRL